MTSRRVYILLGAIGGVLLGIFASMDPSTANLGLWTIAVAGSSGAVLGVSLHATQRWEAHGPSGSLLRWVSALGLAGLVLGVLAGAIGAIPLAGVPATAGIGLLTGCGFGLEGQQRSIFGGDGYRERTAREVAVLWSVILGTIAVVCGLFALSWALTLSPRATG